MPHGHGVDRPTAAPLGIRAVLRIPDFRRIWAAQAVSDVGDGLTNLTLLLVAINLTGSTAAVALMAIALALPAIVVGPIAGVYVDRWDRRRVMLASDLARAAIVLGFIAVGSADQLWLLVVLAMAHASVATFFAPARMALVPRIVPEAGLMAANSLAQITRVIANVIGASAAGVLVGVVDVAWPAFVVDSLTFVLSFLLILGVRTSGQVDLAGDAPRQRGHVGRSLREGLALVARSRLLLGTMLGAAVTMLGLGAVNVLFVPLFVQELDLPTTWLGAVDIAQTSSMILAAALTTAIAARARPTSIIAVGLAAIGICVGLVGAVDTVWQVIVLLFVVGWFVTPLQAAIATVIQVGVADDHRGRVGSTMHAIVSAASVISMGVAGILGDIIGIRSGFYLAGIVVGVAAILAAVVFRGERAGAPASSFTIASPRLDAVPEEAQ
jgi:MFS family permease